MGKLNAVIRIYTDGACEGNQFKHNFGGWGAVILDNDNVLHKISGSKKDTTNNRMELLAVIRAMQIVLRSKLHETHIIHINFDSA